MKFVGQGDFNTQIETKSRDEIGILEQEFNKMVKKTSELMDRVVGEQKKKRESELALLQSQINPHFLYNTLDNICGLAILNRKDEIIETVKNMASFYRGVLSKGSSIIPVSDEISILEDYLKILKLRYREEFEYEIDIDSEILECCIVKLTLQPLVENAIYHGLRKKRGKGIVIVKGSKVGKDIEFHIIDNGVGMKQEDIDVIMEDNRVDYRKKSFGLKGTHERIRLYFGDQYGIRIQSSEGEGTDISILMPLLKHDSCKTI